MKYIRLLPITTFCFFISIATGAFAAKEYKIALHCTVGTIGGTNFDSSWGLKVNGESVWNVDLKRDVSANWSSLKSRYEVSAESADELQEACEKITREQFPEFYKAHGTLTLKGFTKGRFANGYYYGVGPDTFSREEALEFMQKTLSEEYFQAFSSVQVNSDYYEFFINRKKESGKNPPSMYSLPDGFKISGDTLIKGSTECNLASDCDYQLSVMEIDDLFKTFGVYYGYELGVLMLTLDNLPGKVNIHEIFNFLGDSGNLPLLEKSATSLVRFANRLAVINNRWTEILTKLTPASMEDPQELDSLKEKLFREVLIEIIKNKRHIQNLIYLADEIRK